MDGDSKGDKQVKGKGDSIEPLQRYGFDVGLILQSLWVRCRTIFPNATDRKFMESELRFVLYSGVIFWTIYLVYETFK